MSSHYDNADLELITTLENHNGRPEVSVPREKGEGKNISMRLLGRTVQPKVLCSSSTSSVSPHRAIATEGEDTLPPIPLQETTPKQKKSRPLTPVNLTAEEEAVVQDFSTSFASPAVSYGHLADDEHDARAQVPYRISKETYSVPIICHDDLLSGSEKMWRPGKPLRIAYITWNMAGKKPRMGEVSSFCIHPNAHLVVVGTQENGGYLIGNRKQKRWRRDVATKCLGDNYELVGKTHLWALNLLVFARKRDVAAYVSHVHTSAVKTGLFGCGGNKGGVALALVLSLKPIEPSDSQRPTEPTPKPHPVSATAQDDGVSNSTPVELSETKRVTSHSSDNPPGSSTLHTSESAAPSFTRNVEGDNGETDPFGFSPPEAELQTSEVVESPHSSPFDTLKSPQLTLLFVNSHLAAHQGAVKGRNRDYTKIVRELRVGLYGKHRKLFKESLKQKRNEEEEEREGEREESYPVGRSTSEREDAQSTEEASIRELPNLPSDGRGAAIASHRDATEEFDLTIFGGDLNYRIDGTKKSIEFIVQHHQNIRSVLINNDQLSLERAKGTVFHHFHEGALFFRPTYKYEVQNGVTLDQYNYSKKKDRMPAYCDRVLFKRRKGSFVKRIAIKLYTDVPNVRTSDHRPVVSLFEVDTVAYTAAPSLST